jgi:hypothetical protein
MEPTSSTAVSPVVLVAGGIVIGATAATVVIKYQEEIKATGASIAGKAKSLFGKKATPAAIEKPAAEPVAETAPVAEPAVVAAAPAAEPVAETGITMEQVAYLARLAELLSPSSAVKVHVETAPVAEPVVAPVVETAPVAEPVVEAAAPVAEPVVEAVAPVAEAPVQQMAASIVTSSIKTEAESVSDVVLLTQEVAAGIAEAMQQLPQQQRTQQPYRQQGKRHHQRR